jgi:DNA helicase-2/ATP-dependent DNA helicase PcrA
MLLRAAVRAGDAGAGAPDAAAATAAVLSSAGFTAQPPPGGSAARDRWESLKAVVDLAAEVVARKPKAELAEVVAELEGRAAAQHAPVADGVTLASLHAAKGLEWDAVFIVGCHEGTLPLVYADTPAEIAEERRLFYVGITRARTVLRVSWSLSRTPGGQGNRLPSRFLDGVRPATATVAGSPARNRGVRTKGPARCKVCRVPLASAAERKLGRCSACPSSMDDELFEDLRAWRLRRAQEQKVPAFVVFTDATLVAIAETVPEDVGALAAVPGVGRAKLERYGSDVLELCSKAAKKRVIK